MKIIRRLIYLFFLLIVLIAFVFLGGGRTLIRIGERMQDMELAMKETLGGFCKQGEKQLKAKAGKVSGKFAENARNKDFQE